MKLNLSISTYNDNTTAGRSMNKYEGKGYYIHFGRTDKLGVATSHAHSDFNGVYFYKLDWLLKNAHYGQYALTFKHFTIVDINKTGHGINVQTFTAKDLDSLIKRAGLTNYYDPWLADDQYSHKAKASPPQNLLAFYKYCKEHKINNNMLKGVGWIEDNGGGFFCRLEPEQIVVRDLRLVKVVETGETQARVADQMKFYLEAVFAKIGKPTAITSKKDKGEIAPLRIENATRGDTLSMKLEYATRLGFKPLNFLFYITGNDKMRTGWVVEACYNEWIISGYHDGPDEAFRANKLTLEVDDSPVKLAAFAEEQMMKYMKLTTLVETGFTETRVKYLREDIKRISPTYGSDLIDSYKLISPFIVNYVNQLIAARLDAITDEDIIKGCSLFDENNFDMLADEYQFGYNVSKSGIRDYRDIKSKVPPERFEKFIRMIKIKMGGYLSVDNIKDLFNQLESK